MSQTREESEWRQCIRRPDLGSLGKDRGDQELQPSAHVG
jgi:hypothetical protein